MKNWYVLLSTVIHKLEIGLASVHKGHIALHDCSTLSGVKSVDVVTGARFEASIKHLSSHVDICSPTDRSNAALTAPVLICTCCLVFYIFSTCTSILYRAGIVLFYLLC